MRALLRSRWLAAVILAACETSAMTDAGTPAAGKAPPPTPVQAVDLGTLGGTSSGARGVNRSGNVTGWAHRTDGVQIAFFWNGAMHPLELRPGWASSIGSALNDADVVVGRANDGVTSHAVQWAPAGQGWASVILPTLPGYEGGTAVAKDINNAGDVIGLNSKAGLAERVVLWRAGVPHPVPIVVQDTEITTGLIVEEINDRGWIVGDLPRPQGRTAYVWIPDGSGVPGQGRTILLPRLNTSAHFGRALNDDGVIVGWNNDSRFLALRWVPLIPEPRETADFQLQTLAGSSVSATGIAQDGQVIGSQVTGLSKALAVTWTATGTLGQLAPLPNYSGAEGMAVEQITGSAQRRAVGWSIASKRQRATLWLIP